MSVGTALERLADSVVDGKVTFFIGAGFSADSEGNSGRRLIARLLARFAAIGGQLIRQGGDGGSLASRLRDRFLQTFWFKSLPWDDDAALLGDDYLRRLADQYYQVNDWFCSAFADLIAHLPAIDLAAVNRWENAALASYESRASPDWEVIPLDPIRLNRLDRLEPKDAGKALFLDTMGFDNPAVMAGAPADPAIEEVERGQRGRLLPRHRVLARLAMEGWSAQLITTNYDLLIDSAYRLAGMLPPDFRPTGKNLPLDTASARNTVSHCHRIAAASDYFASGRGHRAALIVKMHGCVEKYRSARDSADHGKAYLPAMVFTFREIQNWREDSWSRDLLRSLLRTRTMVFCGYSAQDPVIHDTVRSVYEEMAERRRREAPTAVKGQADAAPAFFFDLEKQGNFHGVEILRAAAQAAGVEQPSMLDCPNLIEFTARRRQDADRFPTLDDLLRWLLHRCLRRRQRQALNTHLGPVASVLLRRPCHEEELEALRRRFDAVSAREAAFAATWGDDPAARRQFERHCSWTEQFHFALLRQWAAADAMARHLGPDASCRLDWQQPGRRDWYCPMLDHPAWTAWGVVLELAIRHLACHRLGRPLDAEPGEWLRPVAADDGAAVDIAGGSQAPTPLRLALSLRAPRSRGQAPRLPLRGRVHWRLSADALPWRHESRPDLPSATALWRLAQGEAPAVLAAEEPSLLPLLRSTR